MKSNSQVVEAFRKQEVAQTQHLSSDGVSLWSYDWWEVARWVDGQIVCRWGKSYSLTTTKHGGLLNGSIFAKCETPRQQGEMCL